MNREYLNETYKSSLNSLAGLQLREKQIEHVEKETFTGLVNLYSIDLGQNEIKHLDKDTFSGLINLREIWLNNNQLEQLDKNIFKGLPDLRAIYLHDNKFESNELDLNLEQSVQYITYKNGWRNDFVFSFLIKVDFFCFFEFERKVK